MTALLWLIARCSTTTDRSLVRVVMVTDDVQIDRRILQEADSLIGIGHEVILIAGHEAGQPRYEWLGKVKIERFSLTHDVLPVFLSGGELRSAKGRLKFRWLIRLEAWWLAFKISRYWAKRYLPHLKAVAILRIRTLARGIARSVVRSSLILGRRLVRRTLMFPGKVVRRLPLTRPILTSGEADPSTLSTHETGLLECLRGYSPDVVHAHDLPQLGAAIYLKRETGIPVVYDAHELYPEISTLTAGDKVRLDQRERLLIRECDSVITVNPLIATEMSRRYKISEPAVVFNAAEPPAGFDPKRPHRLLKEHFSIPDGEDILLYQGWMSKTRGLQTLCSAMSGVREGVHLVFMGYGESQNELEEIAISHNLTRRVHFKSTVSQAELLFWTASADAGVIPYQNIDLNNHYCSPNKLFEFILAGVPIVANDLPFLRTVIEGEGFGLVRRLDDEGAYAEAINDMFDTSIGGPSRFRPRILAEQGRYSWQAEKSKILNLYSGLEFALAKAKA
jgi:glycosyltransferase involved in cell wall biosynthesis